MFIFLIYLLQVSECGKTSNDGLDSVSLPRGWQRHEGMVYNYMIYLKNHCITDIYEAHSLHCYVFALVYTVALCTVLLISDDNGPYYWHIKSGTIQREAPVASPVDVQSDKDATSSSSVGVVKFLFDRSQLAEPLAKSLLNF